MRDEVDLFDSHTPFCCCFFNFWSRGSDVLLPTAQSLATGILARRYGQQRQTLAKTM